MKQIGIMGGTFDPIHNAHLMLGKCALEQCGLDEIWFMPDRTPPHKTDKIVSDAVHRCRMTELALEGHAGFVCSLFEQKRSGFTYTSDTLEALATAYPADRFFFMIGADSLYRLESWHEPAQVMARTTLLVAERRVPDAPRSFNEQIAYLKKTYRADIRTLSCPDMPVSSTEIRARVAAGLDIAHLVPAAVDAYIQAHGLYRTEENRA